MYITILDYSSYSVARIEVVEGMSTRGCEEVIIGNGFKLEDIEWMYHSDEEIYEY